MSLMCSILCQRNVHRLKQHSKIALTHKESACVHQMSNSSLPVIYIQKKKGELKLLVFLHAIACSFYWPANKIEQIAKTVHKNSMKKMKGSEPRWTNSPHTAWVCCMIFETMCLVHAICGGQRATKLPVLFLLILYKSCI